jgi:hypothetical protein
MRRYAGAFLVAFVLFAVGKARGGWPAGIFAGASSGLIALYMGTLVRGRAMRKAPGAPSMLPGEAPLLHGPVSIIEKEGKRDCWAYLSDQRLSLLPGDGGEGVVLELAEVKELRPPQRRLIGYGPLGIVADGQLWQLKVPDTERWLAALRAALHGKG